MKHTFKISRMAFQTLPIVLVLVIIKYVIYYFHLEFVTVHPLYTSIVAGSIFLFGLILAGTLSDYKESERLPAEIASSCDSIFQEGRYCKELHPSIDLSNLCSRLNAIITGFKADITVTSSRKALEALTGLTLLFTTFERGGVPPVYMARMKNEQAIIRKSLMRFYYIQRINFLPSAYILVLSTIIIVIILLLFSRIEPFWDALAVVFVLSFIFIYLIRLLRILETPFQEEGKSMDDVSLFLMEECQKSITDDKDK